MSSGTYPNLKNFRQFCKSQEKKTQASSQVTFKLSTFDANITAEERVFFLFSFLNNQNDDGKFCIRVGLGRELLGRT